MLPDRSTSGLVKKKVVPVTKCRSKMTYDFFRGDFFTAITISTRPTNAATA